MCFNSLLLSFPSSLLTLSPPFPFSLLRYSWPFPPPSLPTPSFFPYPPTYIILYVCRLGSRNPWLGTWHCRECWMVYSSSGSPTPCSKVPTPLGTYLLLQPLYDPLLCTLALRIEERGSPGAHYNVGHIHYIMSITANVYIIVLISMVHTYVCRYKQTGGIWGIFTALWYCTNLVI